MTFDLSFYRRIDKPEPRAEDIRKFLSSMDHFRMQEIDIEKLKKSLAEKNVAAPRINNGYDIGYENPRTGVYFQMFYSTPDPTEESPSFQSLELSGLGAHVNLVRPTYFALESFPLITQIADRFGLLAFDNQNSSTHKEPFKADSSTLVESWTRTNSWAAGGFRKEGHKIPFLPRERLDYTWTFLKHSNGMQQKLGDYVFVPTRIFLGEKQDFLGTFVSWTDYTPMAFPKVDWVVMGQSKGGKDYSTRGFAALNDIIQILGSETISLQNPVPHHLLSREPSKDVRKRLDGLRLFDKKEVKALRPDTVVYVPP